MVLVAPGQMELQHLPVPDVGAHDALLRIDACGVCGSDVARFGDASWAGFPAIIGHEIVGTIERIGTAAAARRGLDPGDRVVVEEPITCGSCGPCLDGRHRLCDRRERFGDRSVHDGPGLWGGFAERLFVPPGAVLHKVPGGVSVDLAVRFIPAANGMSWMTAAQVGPRDDVVVLGPGQNGLATVVAARHLGARTVSVVGRDQDRHRLERAVQAGAGRTATITSPSELADRMVDLTGGAGPSVVIDLVPGDPTTISAAVQTLRPGGRLLLAGAKRGTHVDGLDSDLIFRKELTIRGVSHRESWAIGVVLDLMARAPHLYEALHGPSFPLERVADAIAALSGAGPDPAVHAHVLATGSTPTGGRDR